MTVEQLREMSLEAIKKRPGNLWLVPSHNKRVSCQLWIAAEICERLDRIEARLAEREVEHESE